MADANLTELLDTTASRSGSRACFLLRVRPEKLADYVEVHQAVWPRMLEALSACGWRHYSLFLDPDDGLVVGYFESDDCERAMAEMSTQEIDAIWQAEMAQYFVQPDGGRAKVLRQYFYLP